MSTQPDRTTGYNRTYYGAVTKNLKQQMKTVRFPNRGSFRAGSARPLNFKQGPAKNIETSPYKMGNKGNLSKRTQGGKPTRPY
jgi:hypothetical protein